MSIRVLVIEDDTSVALTIKYLLSRAEYEVKCATNGVEAMRALREFLPALVITDLIMPEQDGIDTIGKIKRELPETRIIAISGGGRTDHMDMLAMARRMGADHTVSKPFSAAELIAAVRRALGAQDEPEVLQY